MSNDLPDCIGVDICLHPSFGEWLDGRCPHALAQCGGFATHGLRLRTVCDCPKEPVRVLRLITLDQLREAAKDKDELAHLLNRGNEALQAYEESKPKV